MSENNPKSAGVVRRIANSEHCLCLSNPRCLRDSWKVTSSRQRITNQRTNLFTIGIEVEAQQGLGFEPSFGIADQNPAQGYGEQARGVPHRGL
jgi:hypothetical protein